MYHTLIKETDPVSWSLCYGVMFGSLVTFGIVGWFIERYATPSSAVHGRWKWRNISVSLIHSIISGVWTLYSYLKCMGVFEDLVHLHTLSLLHVGLFSVGYFMYDFLDVLFNDWSNHKGVLFHHVVASYCMICSYFSRTCISYTNLGLLYEISSITLHTRYLSKMASVPIDSSFWKNTIISNIVIFVVFRYFVFVYMVQWIWFNCSRPDMPVFFTIIFLFANGSGLVVNSILFHTCITKDFLRPSRKKILPKESSTSKNGVYTNGNYISNGLNHQNGDLTNGKSK